MATVAPGDVIAGKYSVERLLGTGGMGYVVAARHIELGQLVAIKFLSRGALADDEAVARFRREARCTVRLTSQHIAKVHDVGVHDGDEPFIVMDYLEGTDLGAVARERGPMPVSEACDYLLDACEALGEAHSVGIVHRDVKLANLYVTKTAAGKPLLKVLDFGISKSNADGAQLEMTSTHMMLGSPRFMSPEQMNDPRSVDARTDIWSLGVVLYRLVAGRLPFDGDTIGSLCGMVLAGEPPSVRELRPDLPHRFEHVVARCLAKDPAQRFTDVAELASALAAFASDEHAAVDRARHIAAVLGVAAPPAGTVVMPRFESFPPTAAPLTASGSITIDPTWSPATTGQNPMLPVEHRTERAVSMLTLALAVLGVVFFVAGVAIIRASAPTSTSAAAAQLVAPVAPAASPPLVAAAPLVVTAPPAAPAPQIAPAVQTADAPPSVATAAPEGTSASPASGAQPAKHSLRVAPARKNAPRVNPRASGLPLPGDRR